MPRFLKLLLIALTGVLAGCPFMLAEAPLGSQAVVLDPKELDGVWAAYAKIGDRYEATEFNLVLFFHAKDAPPGAMELLLAPTDPALSVARFDVLVRQHNGVTFANFRLRQSGGLDPADDPEIMMRAVRVSVVEKLSGDELRLRPPIEKRAGEWIQQGRLPGRVVDFDPFRGGWGSENPGGAEWMLGQLTPEHLDAITTPDGLDRLFPSATPGSGEKKELILRKIRWPPPVPDNNPTNVPNTGAACSVSTGCESVAVPARSAQPMYPPRLELGADSLKDGGTKFSCRGGNPSRFCDVVVYETRCSVAVDKGGKRICTEDVVEKFSLAVGESREFNSVSTGSNTCLKTDACPKMKFCLKMEVPRKGEPPFCSNKFPPNQR